jgi:hypothetical protein
LEFHEQIGTIVGAGSHMLTCKEIGKKRDCAAKLSHLARPPLGLWVNGWGNWVSLDNDNEIRGYCFNVASCKAKKAFGNWVRLESLAV